MSDIMPDSGPHAEHPLDLFKINAFRIDASLFFGADIDLFGGDDILDHDETDLERQARLDAAADMIADDPAYYDESPLDRAAARYRARTAGVVRIPAQRTAAVPAGTAVAA